MLRRRVGVFGFDPEGGGEEGGLGIEAPRLKLPLGWRGLLFGGGLTARF